VLQQKKLLATVTLWKLAILPAPTEIIQRFSRRQDAKALHFSARAFEECSSTKSAVAHHSSLQLPFSSREKPANERRQDKPA